MKRNILLVLFSLSTFFAFTQSPNERLQELVGTWVAKESTFTDPPQGTVEVISSAGGRAIYSTWKQGSNETYYEANALWGYSETTKQIRVFEVNTLGVADTHVGSFNDKGVLIVELRDPETNELLQHRSMTWENDTWEMKARFIINGQEINHHFTLKRK